MKQNLSESIMANLKENDDKKFRYSLLSRLESDCKYFLGNGNRNERHLWAGSVEKQIAKMRELYNSFAEDEKPEWLTLEQIDDYERRMLSNEDNGKEYHIENPTVIEDANKIHEDEELNNKIRGNSMKVRESIIKNLKEGEKYIYITGADSYEDVYNSEANTDVLFILEELEKYFNESSDFVKSVMSSDKAIRYQFPQGEAEMLKQAANKIAEVRNTIDKWYSEEY